jgi:hypothetical protein
MQQPLAEKSLLEKFRLEPYPLPTYTELAVSVMLLFDKLFQLNRYRELLEEGFAN